jgi:hypothetical protein
MNTMKYLGSLLVVLTAAVALTGCEVQAGIDPGPVVVTDGTGSLTLDFTVAGREDGAVCGEFGVAAADVQIIDAFGDLVTDVQINCEDFAGTIDLDEDLYRAEVTLVDANDNALSTTAIVRDLQVIAGTDLEFGVDFPKSSMF